MYDFVDRRLTRLDPGSRFLVWSMRLWVTAVGLRQCPTPAVAPLFARWKAIGALGPFMKTMALLNRDALETFGFCPLACEQVCEHEAIVLAVIQAMDDQRYALATETLAMLVTFENVGDLVDALAQLVTALRKANLAPLPAQSAEQRI
jgi:hypothetical protein